MILFSGVTPDWEKSGGLLPAIVQDAATRQVLMLGYMSEQSFAMTLDTELATFFSRSRNELWVKGGTSGNVLNVVEIAVDCDRDTILLKANPAGPTCHTGAVSCFGGAEPADPVLFLKSLSTLVHQRNMDRPEGSYTTKLFAEGKARIAQKVGEEGVELALARMKDDPAEMVDEAADLLFHIMVLLEDAGLGFDQVCAKLQERHQPA